MRASLWLHALALTFGMVATAVIFAWLRMLSQAHAGPHAPASPSAPSPVVIDVAPPPPALPRPLAAAPANPETPAAPAPAPAEPDRAPPLPLAEFDAPALPSALAAAGWPGGGRNTGADTAAHGGGERREQAMPMLAESPSPASKPAPRVLDARAVDEPPRVISAPPPTYPVSASRSATEGWVDLRLLIEPDGRVSDVRVTGASPKGMFEGAARKAAAQWRFAPARHDGAAVPVWARQRVEFRL